jgi:hypothetical protein
MEVVEGTGATDTEDVSLRTVETAAAEISGIATKGVPTTAVTIGETTSVDVAATYSVSIASTVTVIVVVIR